MNCIAVFPSERTILRYEYADRVYSVEPFFLAYNVIEIPIEIISALLFTVFVMFVVGMNSSVSNYFIMSLGIFLLVNTGESIGMAICSFVDHIGFSVSLTNSLLGIFTVMSGLVSSDMPVFLDRINRLSPVPYIARMMVVNEFSDSQVYTCTDQDVATMNCLYRNGSDVLKLLVGSGNVFGIDPALLGMYIGVAIFLTVVFRGLAFLVLKVRTK